jgi:hypothetical protein
LTFSTLFLLKLSGVAFVVAAASLIARRHGHRAGGLVAGLPLIAGPVTGLLLLTQPAAWVHQLAVATLACLPATVLHQLAFAWAAQAGWRPWAASIAANIAFLGAGALLLVLALGAWSAGLLALLALLGSRWALPRGTGAGASAPALPARPQRDLALRVGAAVALAALLLLGAERVPTAYGGWLLALPIAGNVLPVFALASAGPAATVALLRGFIAGLGAFLGFFAVLALGLAPGSKLGAGSAFVLAVLAAPLVGWMLARLAPGARAG